MNEREIFIAALEQRDPAERAAFLDRACGEDRALRECVEELLREHEQLGSFLERPAVGVAATGAFVSTPGEERSPVPAEGPGMVIGPYKLLQQIGEGGMGAVFMAEQQEPVQRRVALKIIKAGKDSAQVIARFEAERQALALMDHPNIAKVHDGGTIGSEPRPSGSGRTLPLPDGRGSERPFFVMELVKGMPITKYCDEHRLTPRERLELFIPVCQAIQHAHQKGIIHRDIKPSNVLVAPYDGKPVVKVIDFGVAKATGQRLTEKTLFTEFGAVIGTLEYMSPEQAELNNQDIDTRSDIYSLGVLLYELLTGTTPLDRARLKKTPFTEMLRKIREEEPPRPSTRLSEARDTLPAISAQRQMEPAKLAKLVRGELDWIVMKALEKDRNRRYESANAFAADVQRYLNDEPVQACPPSLRYRFSKFARRNKAALLTGSAAVLVVIIAVIGLAINNWIVTRERDQKETARADAVREKERADQNLARAKKAVEKYLLDTVKNPKLKSADLNALRKELLAIAIPFLEEIARQEGDDRRLMTDRAWAFFQLGKVRAEMGQSEAGLADYQRARVNWARLAAELPKGPLARQYLADIDNNSGVLVMQLGRMKEAEAAYRRALTLYRELIADFPAVPAPMSGLAGALNNLANLEGLRGNAKEKKKLLEQALVHEEAAVRANPKDPESRQFLASHQMNLVAVLRDLQEWDEAARALERGRTTIQSLITDFGASPEERNRLAKACTTLGEVKTMQGKFQEAEKAFRQALTVQEKLAAGFPSLPDYRENLAHTYHSFGQLVFKLDKLDDAELAYRRALTICRELTEGFPKVAEYWRDLAHSQNAVGLLLGKQGRWTESEAAARAALAAWERMMKLYPPTPEHAVKLGDLQINLGLTQTKLGVGGLNKGDFAAARSWLDKAVATYESVGAATKPVTDRRRLLGNAHGARAEALIRLGFYKEALPDWDRALQLGSQAGSHYLGMQRALTLSYLKEHARATAEADSLAAIEDLPAYLLHDAATVHAVAAAAVRDQAQLSEKYAARAVALLRRAFEKNYQAVTAEVREDKKLDFLRSREDFRNLLKEFASRYPQSGVKKPREEKKRTPG
jgi:serine/threonine protein kinase/tetratricopeptide (TPR) repeat protein